MTSRFTVFLLTCFTLVMPAPAAWAKHTLTTQEQKVLQNWVARHQEFRIATDEDCDCADNIKQMKTGYGGVWRAVSDYHPYVAVGDFNGDGIEDFAVVVIDRSKTDNNYVLVVFNGPFRTERASPAFISSSLQLKNQGLFYGPPRPRPYRLLVGQFESDSGFLLVPHGRTYRFGR